MKTKLRSVFRIIGKLIPLKDYKLIEKFDSRNGRIGDFAFKGAILKRRS